MPELPEVETVRRALGRLVDGRSIVAVPWLEPRLVRDGTPVERIRALLVGQETAGVGRRGKFLIWRFRSGGRLVMHLGMSGRLVAGVPPETAWLPHTHLVVDLSDGRQVRLTDPRRFGRVAWRGPGAGLGLNLGPEPLSPRYRAADLGEALAGRRAPVKALLLDQRLVAGVGNIYADEALFRARIHPLTPAGRLDDAAVRRLHRALRSVMREAISWRGTTFRDFRDATGHAGDFGRRLRVYARTGCPCPRCRTPVAQIRVAGRSSHFCPRCQPANWS
jgi:formamidopyrimidine-DNA glycosylase